MKRYPESLKEWRVKQKKTLSENLSLYLSIYWSILKAFILIHSHNVTHYDIKCDNILLDYVTSADGGNIKITVGDFGECKMFTSEKDEFDEKNWGTEVIMSPEMLMLAINTRKDTANYDWWRWMGTTKLSDVWSLGCLFYELLTGEPLFLQQDLSWITMSNEKLIPD